MSEPVIGVDLGTTFSAVATVQDGSPELIVNRDGQRLTPSMAGFTPSGDRVVGDRARLLADEHPENIAFAAKRFIGRRWTPDMAAAARQVVPYPVVGGPDGEVRIRIAGRTLPITQISAMVLGELKLDAEARYGAPVSKAVITVPANFDDGQRNATKEAARIAGLDVLRILNEPTAAALAYGLDKDFKGRALVFDLGGGTFDVSILEVQDGVFEVRATGGDPHLGGEDFDNRIVQWLLAQIPEKLREAVSRDRLSLQRLKVAAEKAKRTLSTSEEAYLTIPDLGDHLEGVTGLELDTALTREFFEILSRPLSERCLNVCQQLMREAKMEARSVDAVLLVGGMTRVPLVRQLVTEFFGKKPVAGVDPEEVVALGAALQADEIVRQSGRALLLDVTSHPLGVGMLGGKVRHLIPRNTTVPVSVKEVFLPSQHGQTQVRIPIYEGESDFQDEDHKLGEVVLRDLQVVDRTDAPIEVAFELGADGTLSVKATDLTSGASKALTIEARTSLNPAEERKLTNEQAAYATRKGFERVLLKTEKLVRVLQKSAQENPSEEASALVGSVRSLVELGRAALRAGDAARMQELGRQMMALLR
ncbi:MAG: Hsp70 family protein [Myxococcaceae bacterium]